MRIKKLFLLVLAATIGTGWLQAQNYLPDGSNRIYVNINASAGGNGNDWGNAANNLSDVLVDVAGLRAQYPEALEVWVATGTYVPEHAPVTSDDPRDATFYIPGGVSVYGGFKGDGSEETIADRDLGNNKTTLSGDITGDDNSTIYTDNAYHVVVITQNNVTLDGFAISGGFADGSDKITISGVDVLRKSGAGIYVDGNITGITLGNLTITGNVSNVSGGSGGGLFLSNTKDFLIKNSIITNNESTGSTAGGILLGYEASGKMKNTLIYFNTCLSTSYGADIDFQYGGEKTVVLENVTIVANSRSGSLHPTTGLKLTLINSIVASSQIDNPFLGWNNGGEIICYNSYVQTDQFPNPITPSFYDESCLSRDISPTDLFVDVVNGDLRPKLCSPLINAGVGTYIESDDKDIAGNDRVKAGTVDIGAYEFQGTVLTQHTLAYNPDDANEEYLHQSIILGNKIEDIVFYFGGEATGAVVEDEDKLPEGVSVVLDQDAKTITLSGIPDDAYGMYNFAILTEGPTDLCTEVKSKSGSIVIYPNVNPTDGVLYVKKGGAGTKKGDSWSNALDELSTALYATKINPDIKQIWVGTGTAGKPSVFYPQYKLIEESEDNRDKSFLIANGVKIYGGFDPDNEIVGLDDKRDNSLTVLSGDLGVDGNAYHVVTAINDMDYDADGNVPNIVIDGFSITGGNANGTKCIELFNYYSICQNVGAGIYSEAGLGYVTINGNNIYNNTACGIIGFGLDRSYPTGGGICASGHQTITNNRIAKNTVVGEGARGGGIAALFVVAPPYFPFLFRSSTESKPYKQDIYIAYNQIEENQAIGEDTSGGGIVAYSGFNANFLYEGWEESLNALQILHNTITKNKAGEIYNTSIGGGIALGSMEPLLLSPTNLRSAIDRNSDISVNKDVVIAYNLISENEVVGEGGGIHTGGNGYSQTSAVANNVIVENKASENGGGIFVGSSGVCINNTITANEAKLGGGLYYEYAEDIRIYNTILFGNSGDNDLFLYSENALFNNNLIGTVAGAGTLPSDNVDGNLVGEDYNPEFIGSGNDKYNLSSSSSPAFDAGSSSLWSNFVTIGNVDFVGAARISGEAIEMGAYEIKTCPAVTPNNSPISPDKNGIVYVKDYEQFGGESAIPELSDGSSWGAAHPSLAEVLRYAKIYPGCIREIWVSKGMYYPKYVALSNTEDPESATYTRKYTFELADGVAVYGGFAGTEESIDERTDIEGESRSILSGDLNKNDNYNNIQYADEANSQRAFYTGTEENVFNVVSSINNITSTTVLNGFSIEGGNSDNEYNKYSGGGIFLAGASSPTLSDLVIRYNRALETGGGIANYSLIPVTISYIKAHNNISEIGAGFFTDAKSLSLYHFDIYNNVSSVGRNNRAWGAGGCLFNGSLYLLNGKITGNTIANAGGGLFLASMYGRGTYTLTNVTLADNKAEVGGAFVVMGISGTVENSIIWRNESDEPSSTNVAYPDEADAANQLFRYNIIEGSRGSGLSWNRGLGVDGGFNLDKGPKFVGTGDYPYQIKGNSPAANSGSNSLWQAAGGQLNGDGETSSAIDLANQDRIVYEVIDRGAYEASLCPDNIQPDENGIVYVKDYTHDGINNTSKKGNGSSWEDAHPSLATVLLAAYGYPNCIKEIWVAEGMHYPEYIPETTSSYTSDRDKTFLMVSGVHVIGGFPANATTEENNDKDNIAHRNWNRWKTVLSGNLDYDTDADDTDKTNNAYHVVLTAGLKTTTELNGFIITGGYANRSEYLSHNGVAVSGKYGGGIACYTPDLSNDGMSLYIKNTIITQNYATYDGGGVFVGMFESVVFVNTLIDNNIAGNRGGGVFFYSYARMVRSDEENLRSAISSGDPTFVNVTIVDNVAASSGGGICILDGNRESRHLVVKNSIVWKNTAKGSTTSQSSGIHMEYIYSKGSYDFETSNIQGRGGVDPLFVDATNADINKRNYRLTAESPAVNGGTNSSYESAVGDKLLLDERDLGAIARIQGDIIDMGAYEFSPCPPVVVWLGKTSDWHAPLNWSPALVPQSCTDVYIPGKAVIEDQETYVFPVLTSVPVSGIANNTCDRIFFMPGAQLGRPDLLTYNEAHVEINYNGKSSLKEQTEITYDALLAKVEATHTTGREVPITSADRVKFGANTSGVVLDRGRWNMLSAPLGEISTGDFAFGGFPFSYIQKYDADGETKSYIVGNWADFSAETDLIFQPGQGFGHYYYDYVRNTPFGMDNSKDGSQWNDAKNSGVPASLSAPTNIRSGASGYGLAQSNGILHFPYFDDEYLSDTRRIHSYESDDEDKIVPGISTFNNVWQQLGSLFLQWGAGAQFVNRTTAAYRFIMDGKWKDYEYAPTGTFSEGNIVLVGNPYMSALDFDAFYDANSDVIKKVYHIYQKNNTYVTYGTSGLKYIAPMQSFLVEIAEGVSAENISFLFDAASMAKTSTTTQLRSSQDTADNYLTISVSNVKGNNTAWLRQSNTAADGFCNEDFSKIIDKVNTTPMVYTLTETRNGASRALLLNSIESNETIVPIGIASTYSGEMKLSVSGMDNYDAKVFFTDAVSGTSVEITGQGEFDYMFNYQPGTDSSLENRFNLRFSNSTTEIGLLESKIAVYATEGDLIVLSTESDPILSVAVCDLQGRCILQQSFNGMISCRINDALPTIGVYIVKVQTRQGVKDAKLIR